MSTVRHLTCKTNPISRARGGHAVAAAAYRSAQTLKATTGEKKLHRYSNRAPDVEGAIIVSVEDGPEWHHDRATLWNSVEEREKRKDARTGRDVVLGLAWELTPEERQEAVLEFAKHEFVERGHVVDIAFHKYGSAVREGDKVFDQRSGEYMTGAEKVEGWREAGLPFLEAYQVHEVDMPHVKIERTKGGEITGHKIFHPHAHVMVSPRAWDSETGDWAAKKDPHFNKPETCMGWKYEWARTQNKYLEAAGWDVRISCTSSDSDDALPLKTETLPNQAYHIERRDVLQEPTTAHKAAEFNRVHNDAIRYAAAEMHTSNTADATDEREQLRLAAWWRNMAQHVHAWGDDLKEAAQEWRVRFEQQRGRVKLMLGWDLPDYEAPEQSPAHDQQYATKSPDVGQEPEL